MILVTGANGRVGRLVVNALVREGLDVRALDRNPNSTSLLDLGVKEVVIGDAFDEKIIDAAMEGIDQVVYVPPMLTYFESEMANLACDTAIKHHVKQYVYVSVTHSNMTKLLQHKQKFKAEEHLKYVGFQNNLNWTILQPLHYTHNVIVKDMVETGEYVNFKPLDKKLGYVDGRDVADVVAKVVQDGEKHKYATYELCGDIHLSINEIADMFREISGLPLEVKWTPREELFKDFDNFVGIGNDSYGKAAFMAIRDVYNEYGFDANCNVLEWLLGRKSRSMEDYLKAELDKLGLPHKD